MAKNNIVHISKSQFHEDPQMFSKETLNIVINNAIQACHPELF